MRGTPPSTNLTPTGSRHTLHWRNGEEKWFEKQTSEKQAAAATVGKKAKGRSRRGQRPPLFRTKADGDEEAEEGGSEDLEDGDVLDTTAEVLEDEPVEAAGENQEEAEETEAESDARGSSLARYDPLQAYMREVQRHPLLTPDEEHELAVHYHEDERRRQRPRGSSRRTCAWW